MTSQFVAHAILIATNFLFTSVPIMISRPAFEHLAVPGTSTSIYTQTTNDGREN